MGENDKKAEGGKNELDKLREALATPITREDAEKAFADIDVERCHLAVVRQKWLAQMQQMQLRVNELDARLLALDLDRAVVFRRSLINPAEGEAGDAAAD